MCGRFTNRITPIQYQEFFDALRAPELKPRFNVAPTQTIPVIRPEEGKRVDVVGADSVMGQSRKIGNSLINARADGVASKPSFRSAFKRHRCLIPVDGFYEWKQIGPKEKQPYFIHRKDDAPFAFAGLWEWWKSPEGKELESACLITTEPNDVMAPIHNRMPVILPPDLYDVWMNTPPEEWLVADPVSKLVNKPINDVPQCLRPIENQGQQP